MSEIDDLLIKDVGEGIREELREDKEFARGILCYIMFHHKLLDFKSLQEFLSEDGIEMEID